MHPVFTVVIPTYQRPALLRNCLQALAQQQLPPEQFEVIVVDDANDAATAALTRETAQQTGLTIRYCGQPQRRGPAAARNRGWQSAHSALIAFTDDDCLPQPAWLLVAWQQFRQGAQVLTGRVQMPLPDQPTHHDRTTALLETAEFVTANLFCQRSVLAQVGGFEEQFDSAWREDSDLHFKILRAGIPITSCPEAVIVHPMRPAPWYASLRDERKNRYDALLYKRHPTLFRQRIPLYRHLVLRYYGSVMGLAVGMFGFSTGQTGLALAGTGVWLGLTAKLSIDRLSNRPVDWQSLKQSVLTSLATPFLSIYWRLYGAFKYRTWYW